MSQNTDNGHDGRYGTQPGYLTGFGNDFESEALPGALPQGRNSPQRCNYGLYAEQLSGSPFTAPQHKNERSWLYRIRPSVKHLGRLSKIDIPLWCSAPCLQPDVISLGQYRWSPPQFPDTEKLDFVRGMRTMTTAGDVSTHTGMATHIFLVNASMSDSYFLNADGELLIVPQSGSLVIDTEFGRIDLEPLEIAVIPRGMTFRVTLHSGQARGFVCENYGAPFTLPERGPIGANCLANPRDFKTPVARYEDTERVSEVIMKWCGQFHRTQIDHSPLDVVAWHGNYVPYKYDLRTFSPVGAIAFDHPDPSIFTVLTSPTSEAGTANIDFVIFPPRWLPQENTFKPPWYHRNVMSELMGNIYGQYDAKPEGFVPGGISLHNCMLPHGPDADAFAQATTAPSDPVKLTDTMAFMFETRFPQQVTAYAASSDALQDDYIDCWAGLEKKFDGKPGLKD